MHQWLITVLILIAVGLVAVLPAAERPLRISLKHAQLDTDSSVIWGRLDQ